MKIVRFSNEETVKYGVLDGSVVRGIQISPFCELWDHGAPMFDGTEYPVENVTLLVPCEPTKYLGVGLNFTGAAKMLGRAAPEYPITFLKPTSAVVPSGAAIEIPVFEGYHYLSEGELAVVIGKEAKNVSRENALDYVLGYTCSNDITDFTNFEKDPLKLKCADTFGPVGPCIETELDAAHTRIRSWVNGELKQDGNTAEFIFDIPYMIAFFSSYMTLYPGDVISMGTPAGASAIHPGDMLRIEVDGIGVLENVVKGI